MEATGAVRTPVPERQSTVIEPAKGWAAMRLSELWTYREVAFFLAVRDLKIRYRQTMFGSVWVVLQPLVLMTVISIFVGLITDVPSPVPYPILVLTAMVPWMLFVGSLGAAAASMTMNEMLISKVYFPRLLLPMASAASYLVDFAVTMVLLIIALFVYEMVPSVGVFFLPVFIGLALMATLVFGTLLAVLNVRYRDVQSALPALIQMWMFASPVVYPVSLIPEHLLPLYALNPMATVIEGFRWGLLGTPAPTLAMAAASLLTLVVVGFVAIVYFRRTERTFADVI